MVNVSHVDGNGTSSTPSEMYSVKLYFAAIYYSPLHKILACSQKAAV